MHASKCFYLHCGPSAKVEKHLLETTQKIEGGNVADFCFHDEELTKIRVFKFC